MTETAPDLLTDIEGTQVVYSTFWQRFGASFIDALVLSPIAIVDYFNKWTWKSLPLLIVTILLGLAYKPFMESRYYATLGKMAMNLTVVNTDLQSPNIRNIVLRNIFDITTRVLGAVTTIITFLSADFEEITSAVGFATLSNTLTGATYITLVMSVLTLADAIVMIADPSRRALHDRIGKTLVIRK
jgi:uncharacterized RDD family membrane protein YckC